MFSYAGKTEQEIKEYQQKQKEEYDKKYKGRVDEHGRWISPLDGKDAVFLDGNTATVSISHD